MGRYNHLQTLAKDSLEYRLWTAIRTQGKSDNTAETYWKAIKAFLIYFKNKHGEWVHPSKLDKHAVESYLTHLATQKNVAARTQNQAFYAICFLYRHVLKTPLEGLAAIRAKQDETVRNVVDESEILAMFEHLEGVSLLTAMLQYGCTLRIGEVGKLRVKDFSFERKQIVVHAGKGKKDRVVPFPESLHEPVRAQIESTRRLWQIDQRDGLNGVSLPYCLGNKIKSAHREFAWYYLLTSESYSRCPQTGVLYRHHRDMDHIGKQITASAKKAGIDKRITSHCLRHSFCTHSLERNVPIHVVSKLMGHNDIRTTEGYAHLTKNGMTAAKSPLEELLASPQPKPEEKEPFKLRVFAG